MSGCRRCSSRVLAASRWLLCPGGGRLGRPSRGVRASGHRGLFGVVLLAPMLVTGACCGVCALVSVASFYSPSAFNDIFLQPFSQPCGPCSPPCS